jgi:oligopeptide transport system substrate-binding protein
VGVRALDDLTLMVELVGPTGYFLQLLTLSTFYPVPRHVVQVQGEAWTQAANIVTSGSFLLDQWQQPESMVLERNPAYHGAFKGNVERVVLVFPDEPAEPLEMYRADALDILQLEVLPGTEMERVRQRNAGEYVSAPYLATDYVVFDTSHPPFDDARVRQAFVLATDRATLADVIKQGYVFPATGGVVPPGLPGHSREIALPYEPGEARRLLAEAGYPTGSGLPEFEALTLRRYLVEGEYLQDQWRENLGVEVAWQVMDFRSFRDRMDEASPRIALTGWRADCADPDTFVRANSSLRWARWRNKTFQRLVDQARRLGDQGKRLELYRQADRILVQEAPIIPLAYQRRHLLVKPWVRKYPTGAIRTCFWKDVIIEPH